MIIQHDGILTIDYRLVGYQLYKKTTRNTDGSCVKTAYRCHLKSFSLKQLQPRLRAEKADFTHMMKLGDRPAMPNGKCFLSGGFHYDHLQRCERRFFTESIMARMPFIARFIAADSTRCWADLPFIFGILPFVIRPNRRAGKRLETNGAYRHAGAQR